MPHNGPMTRVKDWLLGAATMLLLIVIAAAIAWWSITTPASQSASEATDPSPSPTATGSSSAPEPPSTFGEGEVWIGELELTAGQVILPDTPLDDVEAHALGAHSSADGLVVAQLEATGTVPFSRVETELGPDSTLHNAPGGAVAMERTYEVLGRVLRIVATGEVAARDGQVHVTPTTVDIGGGSFLSRQLGSIARELVTIEFPIDGLPEGLELQDVDVVDGGFRARLEGQDVVLADGGN